MKKTINTEQYPSWLVSPDIAKELKEIGFDTPCYCYIALAISGKGYQCIEIGDRIHNEDYNSIELRDIKRINYNKQKGCISLPSWEEALAWFRAKGYYGNLEATSKGTSAYIFTPKLDFGDWEFTYEKHYEKAREALLLKLIDLYKTANQ
nr:MAG TPA: hypothetical protein [Caudoviricetes sp.]